MAADHHGMALHPPGNALVLHNPSSGLASRRVEDLAPPKSAYPSVPLAEAAALDLIRAKRRRGYEQAA